MDWVVVHSLLMRGSPFTIVKQVTLVYEVIRPHLSEGLSI
jgi:hypothetical protein